MCLSNKDCISSHVCPGMASTSEFLPMSAGAAAEKLVRITGSFLQTSSATGRRVQTLCIHGSRDATVYTRPLKHAYRRRCFLFFCLLCFSFVFLFFWFLHMVLALFNVANAKEHHFMPCECSADCNLLLFMYSCILLQSVRSNCNAIQRLSQHDA